MKKNQQNLGLSVDNIEAKCRKKNIIVRGIKYSENEHLHSKITDFCKEVLKIEKEPQLETVRPIGMKRGENRTLLCTFITQNDVINILRKSSCLKGTGIDRDYPVGIRLRRNKLSMTRRELL